MIEFFIIIIEKKLSFNENFYTKPVLISSIHTQIHLQQKHDVSLSLATSSESRILVTILNDRSASENRFH